MKIEPQPGFVQIKMESAKAGVLDTSSRESAVELAEVISIGAERPVPFPDDSKLKDLNVGDKIFVKAWAIDRINHNGEWYNFVHVDTKGILAIIKEI